MKTAKIIVLFIFGLFFVEKGLAQSREEAFIDKADPAKAVQLFPNPATEILTIRFEQPHAKKVRLAMSSIIGNPLEIEVESMDDYEVRIRVRDLPSGYYLLAVHDENANSKNTYKFLKR